MKKILPPTYFFIFLVIAVLVHFILPIIQLINYPLNWSGLLFILAGGGLNIWADRLFKKNNTTVKPDETPTSLINNGPFRFSRNPMYLGMEFLLIGTGLILGSVTSFVGAVLFFVAMELLFIRQEEKIMAEKFGDEFNAYKKKVARWI